MTGFWMLLNCMHGWSWRPELCSMPGASCWMASLTLSPGGDKVGVCRWARCYSDQTADGLYRYLVVSSSSAWLKGWGRPIRAEQHGAVPSCCSPATSETLNRRKVLLVKTRYFPKRKGTEKTCRNFSPRSKASASCLVFCKC